MDISEIKIKAEAGKPSIASGRREKIKNLSFDQLVFIPAQLAKLPKDYFREEIKTEIILGKSSKKPLRLKTPILISAFSFGALSKRAKIALAKASSLVGTATNTGEGGMLEEERKEAKILIAQYASGRFGIDENYFKKADAIEIKIGQGAKMGQGGFLPKEKVTEEIAKIRKIKIGEDVHSPASHPDIKNEKDLKNKVNWLRKITQGKPIIIKIGAGDLENDLKIILKANPDVIAIDGNEGGTGAAPKVMMENFGLPTLIALVRARKFLDKNKARQDLIISGGLNNAGDIAKALALGANAVYLGFSLLIALGCIYCQKCYLGQCPVGIATQNPELEKKLNIEEGAKKVANFIKATTEEIKMITAACGYDDIKKLNKKDLRSLSLELSLITRIPLV